MKNFFINERYAHGIITLVCLAVGNELLPGAGGLVGLVVAIPLNIAFYKWLQK